MPPGPCSLSLLLLSGTVKVFSYWLEQYAVRRLKVGFVLVMNPSIPLFSFTAGRPENGGHRQQQKQSYLHRFRDKTQDSQLGTSHRHLLAGPAYARLSCLCAGVGALLLLPL